MYSFKGSKLSRMSHFYDFTFMTLNHPIFADGFRKLVVYSPRNILHGSTVCVLLLRVLLRNYLVYGNILSKILFLYVLSVLFQ